MKERTLATSCILLFCRARIPDGRQRRNSITCSREHQKLYRKLRKADRDKRICDKCGRPCTPQEKAEFRHWRAEIAKKSGQPAKRVRDAANTIKSIAYVVPDPKLKRASGHRNIRSLRARREP